MSSEAERFVDELRDGDGSGLVPARTRRTLQAIASLMQERPASPALHRVCYAAATTIAHRAGTSERTMRAHRSLLETAALITCNRRHPGAGRQAPTYEIRIIGFSDQTARLTGNQPETAAGRSARPTGNPRIDQPEIRAQLTGTGFRQHHNTMSKPPPACPPGGGGVDSIDEILDRVGLVPSRETAIALVLAPIVRSRPFVAPSPERELARLADWISTMALGANAAAGVVAAVLNERHSNVTPGSIEAAVRRAQGGAAAQAKPGNVSITKNTHPDACDAWITYAAAHPDNARAVAIARMIRKHDGAAVPSRFPPGWVAGGGHG